MTLRNTTYSFNVLIAMFSQKVILGKNLNLQYTPMQKLPQNQMVCKVCEISLYLTQICYMVILSHHASEESQCTTMMHVYSLLSV